MQNEIKPRKVRDGAGFWSNSPDSQRLKPRRQVFASAAITWDRIFYVTAASLVLATVAMLIVP